MNLTERKKLSREILFIYSAFIVFILLDPTNVYKTFTYSTTFFYSLIEEKYRFYSFDDFLSTSHILLLLSVYFTTMLFGYSLIQSFLRKVSTNIIIKFFASFSIGYVASLGVIRIVSFFFITRFVFIPTIISILALSGIFLYKNRELEVPKTPTKFRYLFLTIFSLLFLTFLFLLIQVYAGEFAWVGHGPHQYSWFIDYIRNSKELSHFPILIQHHDELLYSYFILDPIDISFNSILPMWVTLALNKISFFSLVYCLFRFLKLNPSQSIIGGLFLLFGTNALNPLKYLMLFDSSNPLAYVVHSTRIVGIGIAFLIIVNIFSCKKNETGFLKLPFFIFSAVGLVFTSISNSSLILVWFLICILFLKYPNLYISFASNFKLKNKCINPIYIVHFTFISIAFGYGILNTPLNKVPGLVQLISGIAIFGLFGTYIYINRQSFFKLSTANEKHTKINSKFFVYFFIVTILSCLFLGNILSGNKLNILIVDFINKHTFIDGLIVRGVNPDLPIKDLSSIRFFSDGRTLFLFNEYCKGFFYFFGYFGYIYILSLIPFLSKIKADSDDFALKIRALLLFTISTLPLIFFHYDFIIYTDNAWIKSRFLELPIYFIVFASIILVFRNSSKIIRYSFFILILVYTVGPVIGTERISQWIQNAKSLSSFIK